MKIQKRLGIDIRLTGTFDEIRSTMEYWEETFKEWDLSVDALYFDDSVQYDLYGSREETLEEETERLHQRRLYEEQKRNEELKTLEELKKKYESDTYNQPI